jgi:hypothetical protein
MSMDNKILIINNHGQRIKHARGGGGGLWRDHQFKNIEKNHISTWILKG